MVASLIFSSRAAMTACLVWTVLSAVSLNHRKDPLVDVRNAKGLVDPGIYSRNRYYNSEKNTSFPCWNKTSRDWGFCLPLSECLESFNQAEFELRRRIMIPENVFILDTAALSECVYAHGNAIHPGVCCQMNAKERSRRKNEKDPPPLRNRNKLKTTFYRGRKSMDRGHLFFRPVETQKDVFSYYEETTRQPQVDDESSNKFPFNYQTHPPFITHPPQATNRPWWMASTTVTTPRPWTVRTTARTTQRPWVVTITSRTTRKPWWLTTTKRTTTAPRTSTSWPSHVWETISTTESTTAFSIHQDTRKYCSPSFYSNYNKIPAYRPAESRITGGRPLSPHSFPWLAVIFLDGRHVCGGSLIDDVHILTAAHCVAGLSGKELKKMVVVLGVHNINRREDTRREYLIKRAVRHREYDPNMLYSDVGVITLEAPVRFTDTISPICLYTGSDSLVHQTGSVAGWGSRYEGGGQTDTPRRVSLRIWSNDECRDTYGHAAPGGIVESYMCAGEQGKDACSGDSGGPIFMQENGIWKQIGIVSWGIGCGKAHYPGVYSRISHFLPWIDMVVDKF